MSVWSLDDFAVENGIEGITVLKIDTEGLDLSILHGARKLLTRRAVRVVVFEYGVHWLANEGAEYSLQSCQQLCCSQYRVVGIWQKSGRS